MEEAMTAFDFTNTGYRFDDTAGRMLYFYFQRSAAGSIYVLWKGYNSEYKNILIDLIVYK